MLAGSDEVEAELKDIEKRAQKPGYEQLAVELKSLGKPSPDHKYQRAKHEAQSEAEKNLDLEPRAAFDVREAIERTDGRRVDYGSGSRATIRTTTSWSCRPRRVLRSCAPFPAIARLCTQQSTRPPWAYIVYDTLPVKSNYKVDGYSLSRFTESFISGAYGWMSHTLGRPPCPGSLSDACTGARQLRGLLCLQCDRLPWVGSVHGDGHEGEAERAVNNRLRWHQVRRTARLQRGCAPGRGQLCPQLRS